MEESLNRELWIGWKTSAKLARTTPSIGVVRIRYNAYFSITSYKALICGKTCSYGCRASDSISVLAAKWNSNSAAVKLKNIKDAFSLANVSSNCTFSPVCPLFCLRQRLTKNLLSFYANSCILQIHFLSFMQRIIFLAVAQLIAY